MAYYNVSQLIRRFIEEYRIELGHGGTPLPLPIGTFPLDGELREAFEREGSQISEGRIKDPEGISNRRIPSVTLIVEPVPTLDYRGKSLVCLLNMKWGGEEGTMPMVTHQKICKAITSVYPKCHDLIKRSVDGMVTHSWDQLGFGEIIPLHTIFLQFAHGRRSVLALGKSDMGVFNPYPSKTQFAKVEQGFQVLSDWGNQLDTFLKGCNFSQFSR